MSTDSLDAAAASTARTGSLTVVHWVGITLAALTGGIHLWLGLTASKPALTVSSVGFAAGIVAVLTGVRRRPAIALGIPFAGTQIALYLFAHGVVGPRALSVDPVGLVDKVVQTGLVAVLVVLRWRR